MSRDRIDVHAHYLGDALGDFVNAHLKQQAGYAMAARWMADEALALMDRHEIAAQILSVPAPFTGAESEGLATRLCRRVNQDFAELITKHPTRFGGFTMVPMDSPEVALAEIAYGLDELGLDGVGLTSNSGGRYFGHPFFEPILAELAARRVPVFVHPVDPPHFDVPASAAPPRWSSFPSTPPATSPMPSTPACFSATPS